MDVVRLQPDGLRAARSQPAVMLAASAGAGQDGDFVGPAECAYRITSVRGINEAAGRPNARSGHQDDRERAEPRVCLQLHPYVAENVVGEDFRCAR
jgi:hypothetical protein